MLSSKLEAAKILEKPHPHVHCVELTDGSKRTLKYAHDSVLSDVQIRELINEMVVWELSVYGKICNPQNLYFHDLSICLERDDYPLSWSSLEEIPDIKIANSDQFPIALGIDWLTAQQDRWLDNKENARFQELEGGSILFALTDNGSSLLGPNGDCKPQANTDSSYTSRLLFTKQIKSRDELERMISSIRSWPTTTLVMNVADKLLDCGCSFSIEKREFILNYCVQVVSFIDIRKALLEKLLEWWDEMHAQTTEVQVQPAP